MKYTIHEAKPTVDLLGLSLDQIRYLHMLVGNVSPADDRRLGVEEEAQELAVQLDAIVVARGDEGWLDKIERIRTVVEL